MAAPSTPRFRLPYSDPEGALLRLDTIVFGGWSPWLDGIVAATRTFAYHGGFNSDGSLTADGTIVIPDASTKYVQRTPAGVVTADAVFDLVNKIPMAIVTAAGGLLTHFEDIREIGFWVARANILALYGGADGGLVISSGGAPLVLPAGAIGSVLTMGAVLPQWVAAPAAAAASVFKQTVIQLHFNGADSSVVFTDSGPAARPFTVVAPAQIKVAQSKFGGASGHFDGSGAQISTITSTDFWLGNTWTIEGWVQTTQAARQYATLISHDLGAFAAGSWSLLFNAGSGSDGKVAFWYQLYSGGVAMLTGTSSIADGLWHHIAVVAFGQVYMLFVDGVMQAVQAANLTPVATAAPIYVGNGPYANRAFNGYLDEWRIVKSAMYTMGFVPPIAAFPDL